MRRTMASLLWGVILVTAGCERDNPNYRDLAAALDLTSGKDLANGPQCGQTMGMAQVKAGAFQMGATDLTENEKPVHSQDVAGFWLDQTEVTVEDYAKCVAMGACTAPGDKQVNSDCNGGVSGREQHPINCVDFFQASAYCAWQCKRLPTEIEWEYAARGSQGSTFPWGNDPPQTMNKPETNLCWKMGNGTCPVRTYMQSSTLLGQVAGGGLYDMAGNVWEWTTSLYKCKYPLDPKSPTCMSYADMSSRVVRGGSWYYFGPAGVRAASRLFGGPTVRNDSVGFRCLRTQ